MTEPKRHIVIKDTTHGLPYSKGLMASSLVVSGLSFADSFRIAERIEEVLLSRGTYEISKSELRNFAASLLVEAGERFASSYLKWQAVEELDLPLVILLGGATGVGKSTVATQLAARLGITRVISTDAIREVLRSAVSAELMPTLHVSTFDGDSTMVLAPGSDTDPVIAGFQAQVQAVAIGIKALIARALEEGTDIIVEGAHVVPGFLDGWDEEFADAVVIPIVMVVGDESLHESHFHMRAMETRSRPQDRYLPSLGKIRRIQVYIAKLATRREVPVVEAFDLDSTLQQVLSIVMKKALEFAQNAAKAEVAAGVDITEGSEPRRNRSRLKTWEVIGRRKN
ncbi:MAG: AAA family ATPase [Actinomycetota bacterium]